MSDAIVTMKNEFNTAARVFAINDETGELEVLSEVSAEMFYEWNVVHEFCEMCRDEDGNLLLDIAAAEFWDAHELCGWLYSAGVNLKAARKLFTEEALTAAAGFFEPLDIPPNPKEWAETLAEAVEEGFIPLCQSSEISRRVASALKPFDGISSFEFYRATPEREGSPGHFAVDVHCFYDDVLAAMDALLKEFSDRGAVKDWRDGEDFGIIFGE